jgi:sigma-B regulation protein RsbU (phosphoserine phosphatase)
MKLLIAEDDSFFQKLLQQILAPQHELIMAGNGNEAWAVLQRPDAPRLAILDWVMPGLSGPEICRKVRACESLSSTYLILLTAKNNQADIVSGLRAGADDYITKPPIPAELQARVKAGERILALQDAVAAQSGTYDRAPGIGKRLCESLSGCPVCQRESGQKIVCEVQGCTLEPAPCSSTSCAETVGLMSRLSKHSLENLHSGH